VSDRHGLVVDKGLMKSVCFLEQTSERQPLVHGSRHVIIFMIISYQIFFTVTLLLTSQITETTLLLLAG